ncbi:MAG TPA: MFS transporter, partial [Acidobacteriaceae bacterium]
PAWQAIVPELVPREEIPAAVTLNGVSNNIARAVGPALGGVLVAFFADPHKGAGWTFALNSISFVAVIWVLWRWKRTPIYKSALPAERIAGSVRSGLRYLRYSPTVQGPFVRAFVFTFFVSAMWSLLAIVARRDLHQGATGYGILTSSIGLGAILGATSLARMRQKFEADTLLFATTLYYAFTMAVLGLLHEPWIVIPTLLGAGFCWTTTMSTLNVSVQLSVPAWVYARALGMYLMTFQGGLALGSVVWGLVAEHSSVKVAMLASGAGLLVTLPFLRSIHIMKGTLPDVSPYRSKRNVPSFPEPPEPGEGPVRISLDYRIPVEHYPQFSHAVHALEAVRLRGGAVRWGIYRDAQDPEHLNETFIMESWLDYLRSRERMTAADHAIRERVYSLHRSDGPPKITYQIWAREVE